MNLYLRTGDVERELGITRRQLQGWRESGLVEPEKTTAGGHSCYGPASVRKLRLVKALRAGGLSVQRIRDVLPALAIEVEAMLRDGGLFVGDDEWGDA